MAFKAGKNRSRSKRDSRKNFKDESLVGGVRRTLKLGEPKGSRGSEKMPKTEQEWEACLTPEQYNVLREKGTEAPFTGKYYKNKEKGMYICAACGNELFSSDTKYDSGTGWPSFFRPVSEKSIEMKIDASHFMIRTEVLCKKCGGHLGHVFSDGPLPTGKRFCINSAALNFKKSGTAGKNRSRN